MSWTAVLLLSVGSYALKAGGLVALGGRPLPAGVLRFVELLPPALLMALIVVQTLGTDSGGLAIDARLAGMAVAAIAVWRRLPFPAVIAVAVVTTALLRAWA